MQIRQLKERIEEMSNDFSSILRDTLHKLNDSLGEGEQQEDDMLWDKLQIKIWQCNSNSVKIHIYFKGLFYFCLS